MGADWTIIIASGGLIASIFVIFSRMFDKSLSIREHEQFRRAMETAIADLTTIQRTKLDLQAFADWREQFRDDLAVMRDHFRHQIDRLDELLRTLDRVKPTTSELETAASYLKENIQRIEREMGKS